MASVINCGPKGAVFLGEDSRGKADFRDLFRALVEIGTIAYRKVRKGFEKSTKQDKSFTTENAEDSQRAQSKSKFRRGKTSGGV